MLQNHYNDRISDFELFNSQFAIRNSQFFMIRSMEELEYQGKTVLLRVDINSPIDPETKKIVDEN